MPEARGRDRRAPIERRAVERTVDVVGTLKGWEEVTVGSKRMGRVLKVLHDMGDRVRPGEPLVELDRIDDDAAVLYAEQSLVAQLAQVGLSEMPEAKFDRAGVPVVDQARALIEKARKGFDVTNVPAVVQARYALEKARQNFARERALRQRGAGTPQDYQNAEVDEHAAGRLAMPGSTRGWSFPTRSSAGSTWRSAASSATT